MASKAVRQLIRELEKQGWTVELTKGNHYKATPPGSKLGVYFPSTPSDWRSLKNVLSELRKRGFQWPGK